MNTYTRVNTGLEGLLARRQAAIIGLNSGLAGIGDIDTFDALGAVLAESGEFAGIAQHIRDMRRKHAIATHRVLTALPVAVSAFHAQSANLNGMGGLKSDIKKALKSTNVTKIQKALAAEQKKIDKAPNSKKAVKRREYVAQLQAQLVNATAQNQAAASATPVLATPDVLAAAGVTPSMTPAQAGAAVLAAGSGASFASPEAQQFAQDAVTQAATTGDTGLIFGMSPLVAGAVGIGAVGALFLLLRKKR